MDNEFAKEENLFRSVPNLPEFWKDGEDRPTTALFKTKIGVSVDRDGGRSSSDIVSSFKSRFGDETIKAVLFINAGICMEIGTHLVYAPVADNVYHAEIHDSAEKIEISAKGKLRKLVKNSNIVYKK